MMDYVGSGERFSDMAAVRFSLSYVMLHSADMDCHSRSNLWD